MATDFCVKTTWKSSSLVWNTSNVVKKRRITRDWGGLDCDVLQQILSCLSSIDILQAKLVCKHWYSVIKLQSCQPHHAAVPLLLIPPQEEDVVDEEDKKATSCCFLVSPDGRKVYNSKKNMAEEICSTSCCIGSSHGWMIFLDEKIAPFLLNLLSGSRIEFPTIDSISGIERIGRDDDGDGSEFHIDFVTQWSRYSISTKLLRNFIPKAILTSNSREDKNFGMVLICSQGKKIVFCNHRDNFWIDLSCKRGPYVDILSHENKLYALNEHGSVVEVWEFGSPYFPAKKMTIELPFPRKSLVTLDYYRGRCASTLYLAESGGEILLVVRFIGELVDGNGKLLTEGDLLTDESTHPLVCPYQTILFHLHKLDMKNKQWLDVDSLHDRVLFLGGNHSISISASDLVGSEGNSIYFIDDYWMRMDEDYLYGGHDMGEYNLKDKTVKPFYEPVAMKILPPACWILPNSL